MLGRMESLARWLYPIPDAEAPDLAMIWDAGDWAMYPILLIGLVAIPLVILTLIFAAFARRTGAARTLPLLLLGLGVLPIGVGMWAGHSADLRTEEAVRNVNPDDVELILEAGRQESQVPRRFGLLVGLPILLLGGALTGAQFLQASRLKDAGAPNTSTT
jgi:hypothetical protein